jgi:hypothetical protein
MGWFEESKSPPPQDHKLASRFGAAAVVSQRKPWDFSTKKPVQKSLHLHLVYLYRHLLMESSPKPGQKLVHATVGDN